MTRIFDLETVDQNSQQTVRTPDYVRNCAIAAYGARKNLADRHAETQFPKATSGESYDVYVLK